MEDLDFDEGEDSDAIDEEVEHRLYNAIFFEPTFSIPPINPPSAESTIADPPPIIDLTKSPSNIPVESIMKSTMLNVTSFKDDSDSDEFTLNILPHQDEESESSTNNELDSDSVIDLTSADDSIMLLGPAAADLSYSPKWSADDVVLGVSQQNALSVETQLNESADIARRLSSVSSNPDLWRLDPADRLPSTTSGFHGRDRRYFKDAHNTVCMNCHRRGHFTFECQSSGPTCILCGREGHEKRDCEDIYCFACLARGHTKQECPNLERLKHSICQRCGLEGHRSYLCTELWRQYMFTPSPGKPIRPDRHMLVHPHGCCNCGNRGHTVDDCRRKPLRSNFLGPSPRRRVLVYDKEDIFSKLRRMKKHKASTSSLPEKTKGKKKKLKPGKKLAAAIVKKSKSNSDLAVLEQQVNKRLLAQVMQPEQQHCVSVKEQFVSPSLTSLDRLRANRANESAASTEQAFLPLNKVSQSVGKKDKRKWGHTKSQTTSSSVSPFMRINQRTALGSLNDDRISSTPEKQSFYLGGSPPYHPSTPVLHLSSSNQVESSKCKKKKKKKFKLNPSSTEHVDSDVRKPTKNKRKSSESVQSSSHSVSAKRSFLPSHPVSSSSQKPNCSKQSNNKFRSPNDFTKKGKNKKNNRLLLMMCEPSTANTANTAISSNKQSNWLNYVNQPPQIDSWDDVPATTNESGRNPILSPCSGSGGKVKKNRRKKFKSPHAAR